MRERISKDGSTRILLISIFIPFALSLVTGCQWSRGGTLPVTPNAQQNSQPGSSRPEPSAASPDMTLAGPVRFTEADFAQHVDRLRARLTKMLPPSGAPVDSGSRPATEFSIVIQAPFVVIGDEPKQALQQRAEGTVKWAVDRLKQDFFLNDPRDILDIWLFKDAASYEKHTRLLFGETPTTPYGYYSSYHKALIMKNVPHQIHLLQSVLLTAT
jgi:hypothetical protein